MTELLPFSDVSHLFSDFSHTAWRLETRKGYAADRRSAKWRRYLGGEDIGQDPDNEWRRNVRAQAATGKRFERVRLVDDPPTQGQRFLLMSAVSNVAAGEDIRILDRTVAAHLGLPERDFWLFDSRVLATLVFDTDDDLLGVELTENPASVVAACQIRDSAWHHAVALAAFRQRVRSDA